MGKSQLRRQIIIYFIDLFIALLVFFFSRYAAEGVLPRWYWLVATSFTWAAIGILSKKLSFEHFKKVENAITGIVVMDIVAYAVIFIIWVYAFPEKNISANQIWPLFYLILLEIVFYFVYRTLMIRKLPFLYEEYVVGAESERAMDKGITLSEFQQSEEPEFEYSISPDVARIHDGVQGLGWEEAREWILDHASGFEQDSMVLDSNTPEDIFADERRDPRLIVALAQFNDTRHLNTFLSFANYKLVDGGALMLHGETSGIRKEKLLKGNPFPLNHVIVFLDYIWTRIFPKLDVTRWLYMGISEAKDRNLPRVEILGRISRAGFTIVDDNLHDGEYYVTAVKTSKPIRVDKPSYGPLIRLQRVGKDGKMIGVYKFRTMYAYSEYLQAYAYQRLGLQDGGKLKDDFRVSSWGRFMRRTWLDEIPMIINLVKGNLKLVGVRPLSKHYFSLYTPEMQALRITVKPGLIPPFYYEKTPPKTIEDVQESERRYIESYMKAPFRTDVRYLFGSVWNIVFRRERSN